jgi:hypothetical protein
MKNAYLATSWPTMDIGRLKFGDKKTNARPSNCLDNISYGDIKRASSSHWSGINTFTHEPLLSESECQFLIKESQQMGFEVSQGEGLMRRWSITW